MIEVCKENGELELISQNNYAQTDPTAIDWANSISYAYKTTNTMPKRGIVVYKRGTASGGYSDHFIYVNDVQIAYCSRADNSSSSTDDVFYVKKGDVVYITGTSNTGGDYILYPFKVQYKE